MSSHSASENKNTATLSSAALDSLFSALSHPVRRQILVILYARGGQMNAGEIADRFKHSWPTTTRHLGVLEKACVIEVGKEGRNRMYSLKPELLTCAAEWLMSWAADTAEIENRDRPAWANMPYATMRNAMPPEPNTPRNDGHADGD